LPRPVRPAGPVPAGRLRAGRQRRVRGPAAHRAAGRVRARRGRRRPGAPRALAEPAALPPRRRGRGRVRGGAGGTRASCGISGAAWAARHRPGHLHSGEQRRDYDRGPGAGRGRGGRDGEHDPRDRHGARRGGRDARTARRSAAAVARRRPHAVDGGPRRCRTARHGGGAARPPSGGRAAVTAGGNRGGAGAPQAEGLAEGIARLRRALRRGARVADPGNTLAVAQLELLTALAEQPGARPGQLARRLNMRANTVTTIVNALSARGMLERVAADDDRRAVELTVTEAGRQAVLSWQATNAAVLHLALSTLPAKQRRALAVAVPALDALARAIDQLADSSGTPQDHEAG